MSTSKRTPSVTLSALALVVLTMASCGGGDPNSPGVEYMPDMYRSPAMEAYVDFGQDPYVFTEEVAKEQRQRQSARLPVAGTIPFAMDASKAQFNMPYNYPNTVDGYEAAGLNLKSPIMMTEATVEQGKVIYTKFCMHCHGGEERQLPSAAELHRSLEGPSRRQDLPFPGLWQEHRHGPARFAIEQGGTVAGGAIREVLAERWQDERLRTFGHHYHSRPLIGTITEPQR